MLQNNTRITRFVIPRAVSKSGIASTILEISLYLQDNHTLQYQIPHYTPIESDITKLRYIYDRLLVLILRAQRSPPSASLYFLNIYRGWIPDNRSISSVPLTIVWLLLSFDDVIATITSKNLVLFVNCIIYAYITCNHRQILDYRHITFIIKICMMISLKQKLYQRS